MRRATGGPRCCTRRLILIPGAGDCAHRRRAGTGNVASSGRYAGQSTAGRASLRRDLEEPGHRQTRSTPWGRGERRDYDGPSALQEESWPYSGSGRSAGVPTCSPTSTCGRWATSSCEATARESLVLRPGMGTAGHRRLAGGDGIAGPKPGQPRRGRTPRSPTPCFWRSGAPRPPSDQPSSARRHAADKHSARSSHAALAAAPLSQAGRRCCPFAGCR